MIKKATGRSPETIEVDRILGLPTRGWPNAELVEIESFDCLLATAYDRGARLLATQAAAMRDWRAVEGGLFPINAGYGKTGIGLMIAQDSLNRGLAKRVLWLMPVQLVAGIIRRHVPEWRPRVNLPMSIHYVAGLSPGQRRRLCSSGAPGTYLFPYSLLSRPDAIDLLRSIDADVVIADEAHRLKHPRAGLTKRLMAYLRERQPTPKFVAMSGTITSKGLMDYHHLAVAALQDKAPLPRQTSMAYSWSLVLDARAEPLPGQANSVFRRLIDWAGSAIQSGQVEGSLSGEWQDVARKAYRLRLVTTPGIVATPGERPAQSLLIQEHPCEPPSERLLDLMDKVTEDYETPDGELIDHAIHCYKWLSELCVGFYNSLRWHTSEELARGRRISIEEAARILERAKHHLMLQQEYHRALRSFFKEAPLGLDTPQDVALAIIRGQLEGTEVAETYLAMRAADFPGRPDRHGVPVRVCDHKIRAAAEWAREHGRGLIWVYHQEIGRWVYETLKQDGQNVIYCPAGADALLESVGDPVQGGRGDKIAVASLSAHGIGRNLQAFAEQLFLQWPRDAALAEQTMARTHRLGQEADEVSAHVMVSCEFDRVNRAACLSDAVYVQQTTGADQRILYCDYDPLPAVYPESFLRERGAAPFRLDAISRDWIRQRFGDFSALSR